jgi:transcription initiation factor TFIIIB Brf1 subunit/transcription initiation factor TFIIB
MKEPYKLSDETIDLACKLVTDLRGKCRGMMLESMCASALYTAAKCKGEFIPLDIILNNIQGNMNECKNIVNNRLKKILKEKYGLVFTPPSAKDFIYYFFRVYDGPWDEEWKNILLNHALNKVEKVKGGSPKTKAGAAIYYIFRDDGWKVTQKDIADALGLSAVSLRLKYAEL